MRFLRSVFAGSVVIVSSHAAASDQCLELCASATVKGVLGCKEVYESERRLAGDAFKYSEAELRDRLQEQLKANGRNRSQAQIVEDNIVSSVDSLIANYKFQEANNLIGNIFLKFDRSVHALQELVGKQIVIQTERRKLGLGDKTVAELTEQLAQARKQKGAGNAVTKLETALKHAAAEQKLSASIDVLVDFIARNFLVVDRLNGLLMSTIQRIEADPKLAAKYDRPNTGNDFIGKLRELHRSLGDPIAWKQEGALVNQRKRDMVDAESLTTSLISETRLVDRLSDFDATGRRNDPSWRRLSAAEIVELMKPFKARFDRSRLMRELEAERDFFWASIAANASIRQMIFQVLRKGAQTVPWLRGLRSKDWQILRSLDNILSIYDYELNHSWKIYDVVQTGFNEAITPANRARHQANRLRDFANELGADGAVLLEYFYRRTDTVRFRQNIEKAADDLAKKGETAFQQALAGAKSRVYASDGSAKQPMLSPTDPSFRRYVKFAVLDNLLFAASGGLMFMLAGNLGLVDTNDVWASFDSLWTSDVDAVLTGDAAKSSRGTGVTTEADAAQESGEDAGDDGLKLTGQDKNFAMYSAANDRWSAAAGPRQSGDRVTSTMLMEVTNELMDEMRAAAARGDASAKTASENFHEFSQTLSTIRFE